MRVENPAVSRPLYYDRTPAVAQLAYTPDTVTPHAQTERAVYTVASAKKAMMESAGVEVVRSVAATSGALANVFTAFTPSGGAESRVLGATLMGNVVGDLDRGEIGAFGVALAGDRIRILTNDTSTDGALHYRAFVKYVTFDA